MVNYQNTWVPGNWTGVGPILPATVDNALGYYQQLKIMVAALNETRANCDNLADYTNEQLQNIVDYLNERIKDFDNAMNEFFKNTTAALDQYREDFEQFKIEMLAAYEQFTQELLTRQDAFEQRIDAKIEELEGEWDATKAEWETVKAEWASLKAEWQQFKEDLLDQFEAFKEEVRNMFENFKNQTNESLEQWKEETFQYFLGQYETIKQLLISQLPEIVQQYLPEALAGIAGVGLKYNPDTVKIDVNYGVGLAIDGEGRLFATGGGSGGNVVEAGQGIDIQSSGSTQTIAVKLASDSPNLEFDESGGLRATGVGSGGGGDTIAAGEGINITGEGTKTIQTAPATANTLGGVKTGDKNVTGLEVTEDGTIQLYRRTPTDISGEQEIFDENLQPVTELWTVDCNYNPYNIRKSIYIKLSANTLEQYGIPDRQQVIDWVPDIASTADTKPTIELVTQNDSQIGSQNLYIELNPKRNGTGDIVLSWNDYEEIINIKFKLIKADMILNAETPIKVGGLPIRNNDTITFDTLDNKKIEFILQDETILQNIKTLGNPTGTKAPQLVTTNKCCSLVDEDILYVATSNIASGTATLRLTPISYGIGPETTPVDIVQFNISYNPSILEGLQIVQTDGGNTTIDSVSGGHNFKIVGLEKYKGDKITVSSNSKKVLTINNYSNQQIDIVPSQGFNLFGLLEGTATLQFSFGYLGTSPLFDETIQVVYNGNQPHIEINTNSTEINNPAKDIGNPQIDNSENRFSKAQGNIEFDFKQFPSEQDLTYQNRTDGIGWISIRTQAGETLLARNGRNDDISAWNDKKTIDFSSATVGSQLIFKFEGASIRNMPTYEVVIGQVVD